MRGASLADSQQTANAADRAGHRWTRVGRESHLLSSDGHLRTPPETSGSTFTVVSTDSGGPCGPAGGMGGEGVFVPPVGELAVAALVKVAGSPVNAGDNRATKANEWVEHGATLAVEAQGTVAPAAVQPSVEVTKKMLAGSVSVAPTFGAADGPVLLTVSCR